MTEGKKYVVLAPEIYEIMLEKSKTIPNVNASMIGKTEGKLASIWEKSDISPEEKVRLHTQELNTIRRLKTERNLNPSQTNRPAIDRKQLTSLKETLIQSLPVSLRTKAGLLVDYLENHSAIISWNDKRELIYIEKLIDNSNVIDLFSSVVRPKGSMQHLSPFVVSIFAKGLAESNVPREWIKNRKILELMTAEKQTLSKEEKDIKPSPKRKKKDWVSF